MNTRRHILVVICLILTASLFAQKWRTHLAYNNVTQIAMADDRVYAISDGSLYSVEKQSEQIKVYNSQSGLHGTGITCIHYDEAGRQLLIGYGTGKIDLLKPHGVQYISELYTKDMTQRKTIYNITISGRTAYLATAYGIQTMDLRENKLVDSYWLRPGGEETEVKDVLLNGDSIYAFTSDSLYCASRQANLVDYRVWKREVRSSRIEPDSEKGQHYQDATNNWYAGHGEGIVRFTGSGRICYKPNGPIVNIPYRLRSHGSRIAMLSGGYAIPNYGRPGTVMMLENNCWTNLNAQYFKDHLGLSATDFCDIAFAPNDAKHFFVASFGYGLMEFRQDTFYCHHTYSNSALEPVIQNSTYPYIWVDGLQFDSQGNLWMLNNSYNGVKVLLSDGKWVSMSNTACQNLERSKDLLISVSNPNVKFVSSIRNGIGVFDDKGTIEDQSDDRAVLLVEFRDIAGNTHTLDRVSSFIQTPSGVLLIGTETGLYRIDSPEELLNGNSLCIPVALSIPQEGREDIFAAENIRSLAIGEQGYIWVGTQYSGVYCVSADLTEVVNHFSIDNSPMPSNDILSLCWVESLRHLFIGTSEGLVEYAPEEWDEGLKSKNERDTEPEEGSMQRWRLHLSYLNPTEIAATGQGIFAVANGSLFSVDKEDDRIVYWNKATGLNGIGVTHIAYDANSAQLIIAYENGQIDLLSDGGEVTQMADISIKAGSIDVTINDICIGKKQSYLAMPFGIIAIQPRKGEVSDTYYIGSNAASIEVEHLVEMGDTLYAFSYDRIYKASTKDNMVDYTYWQKEQLPFEQVQEAVIYREQIYVVAHDSLYRRGNEGWQQVINAPIAWVHVSGNQMIVYQRNKGLFKVQDDGSLAGLTDRYVATDAVFSDGEYWLAEESKGLVRLSSGGDDRFVPEGPLSNFGYHLDVAHDQLYVAPGGRWAATFGRQSSLSIYDGSQWRGIPWPDTWYYTNHDIRDAVQYAVDTNDPGHFFVATYSTGVFEFKNYKGAQHYDNTNSTLRKYAPTLSDYYYTCTDGAMMDEQGNLWVLNATQEGKPVHVRTPQGQWFGLNLRNNIYLETPAGIWIDQRNTHHKWIINQRETPSLILLDDGGTPTISSDDRSIVRSSLVDQNGNAITPANFRCFAQDKNNRIWVGTDKGIIIIPKEVDFFSSNACRRIIIPRNDGTGLGDYLLGDEQINCLAVDGGNRIWIGTANSGLYLMEDDTITVAHFTEYNSLLPSNGIQSIAIMPKTGEVFVGTDLGIASYRSDASEGQENMSGIYAFPNPVRPNYSGMISITGLMENTTVNIVDEGGNLVCKTKSHGGTAVWDGKLPDGRRATPGVYTALCNANGGHTVVKILVIR